MNKQCSLIIFIIFSLSGCNDFSKNKLPEEYESYKSLDSISIKDTIEFGIII